MCRDVDVEEPQPKPRESPGKASKIASIRHSAQKQVVEEEKVELSPILPMPEPLSASDSAGADHDLSDMTGSTAT